MPTETHLLDRADQRPAIVSRNRTRSPIAIAAPIVAWRPMRSSLPAGDRSETNLDRPMEFVHVLLLLGLQAMTLWVVLQLL